MQSLRRAFHEAGAQTVVSSLWKVDDLATRKLMTAFYEGLWQRHLPVSKALRQARLALLKDRSTRAPRYWGAFTLSGEWR